MLTTLMLVWAAIGACGRLMGAAINTVRNARNGTKAAISACVKGYQGGSMREAHNNAQSLPHCRPRCLRTRVDAQSREERQQEARTLREEFAVGVGGQREGSVHGMGWGKQEMSSGRWSHWPAVLALVALLASLPGATAGKSGCSKGPMRNLELHPDVTYRQTVAYVRRVARTAIRFARARSSQNGHSKSSGASGAGFDGARR